jgi:hypothetical protein
VTGCHPVAGDCQTPGKISAARLLAATKFPVPALPVELNQTETEILTTRTKGWMAGVPMTAVSRRDRSDHGQRQGTPFGWFEDS